LNGVRFVKEIIKPGVRKCVGLFHFQYNRYFFEKNYAISCPAPAPLACPPAAALAER
jgi:hypothetical protein